ncbi:MAG: Fe-S protein assembly co-chaperone HscB [Gammaproteobacteria bacterium]|nr:Fe-S protein assembly co-chaperone HscB [Gammaproteobacteria bacterium]
MSNDILTSNFFELFDLPVSYDVDLTKIQQWYMQLQKQVHPDKFANASDREKSLSMQQTSWLNEAKTTLESPVLRATYLLKLKGLDINLENETTMDAVFLMQQLEMRERLENVKNEADPLTVLDAMAKDVKATTQELMNGFSQSYINEELDDAREWIRKLQFLQKAKKEINTLITDVEDELMS